MHRFLVLVGLARDTPENLSRIEHRWVYQVVALVIAVIAVFAIVKLT